jgi:predicted GNAT family N-acyltransferase
MCVAELPPVSVRPADWTKDEAAIAQVRRAVFIEEQRVPEALEWEGIDAACDWYLALQGQELVGIVRLTPDCRLGRMAVLAHWRGRGVGRQLLESAMARARARGCRRLTLSAQVRAMPFYVRAGFTAEGPEFMDAGIAHRKMFLDWQDD